MNSLEAFLTENWQRLALDRFGFPDRWSYVLATPQFRTSAHVVFLVLSDELSTPVLVGKVSRLTGDGGPLAREAANLRRLQTVRAGGFDSVPQLVWYERNLGRSLLLETAVIGAPVDLRGGRATSKIDEVVDWLIELHTATMRPSETVAGRYTRLAREPRKQCLTLLPGDWAGRHLIDGTLELTRALHERDIPLVFEHRDLCPPNILAGHAGRIGIVDWELADPDGLPATDLFFFLTSVAFARDGAVTEKGYLASFQRAFFGHSAWARRQISRYAARVGLPLDLLAPLFVLCWSRYVATLAGRLHDVDHEVLESDTVGWLLSNRYYALWNYAVDHYDDLNLYDTSSSSAARVE